MSNRLLRRSPRRTLRNDVIARPTQEAEAISIREFEFNITIVM